MNTIGTNPITITGSSFHDCKTFCIDVKNINNANIYNNVFYNARTLHIRALSLRNFTFSNNLMIAATKKPTVSTKELIACYMTYEDITNLGVSITNNLCQGSAGHGFVFPFFTCDYLSSPPYSGNTAGSA